MDGSETSQRIKLRKSMMGLLARREHSRLELAQKMQIRGFDTDLVNSNLDDFTHRGWQSDLRYAEMLVRSRIMKSHGPVKIKMELKQKGLSTDIIETSLDVDINWLDVAVKAMNKKFSNDLSHAKDKQKCYRFLQQRGFSHEQINSVLKSNAII